MVANGATLCTVCGMADNEPRKVVNLRLPPDLHARLKAFADRTERSMNGAAVLAIRELLDRRDAAQGDDLHLR